MVTANWSSARKPSLPFNAALVILLHVIFTTFTNGLYVRPNIARTQISEISVYRQTEDKAGWESPRGLPVLARMARSAIPDVIRSAI